MNRTIAVVCVSLALGATAPALATLHSHESHDSHHSAQGATSKLTFDHGRKWATDAPLRRHMGDIRDTLAARSHAILAGSLSDAEAKALGAHIESRVAAIVTDCKLPPAADANLHLVVADLVRAADILQGRTKQKPQQGTAVATRAAQMYATYFDHPGWQPVHLTVR